MKFNKVGESMVSIIIPVYNVEKYIGECIESILNQTYLKIEIILINDGSTDLSGEICDIFKKKYSNITVIHQINCGSGKARNAGLDRAIGQYVMFCDPDDWLPKDAVEKHVNAIIKSDADLTIGFIEEFVFDSNGKFIKNRSRNVCSKSIINQEALKENFFELYNCINLKSPCNKLYKAEKIVCNELKFPDLRRSQDIVFNNEYLKYIEKAEIIDEYVYNRRVINDSIYSKLVGDFTSSRVKVYESFKDLLLYWNLESKESKKFLNKVLYEIIWSYYGYIINNSDYTLFEKLDLMDEGNINKLWIELRANRVSPSFDRLKARILYYMIYYNFKLPLIMVNYKKN